MNLLIPSLKVTGGNIEAIKLIQELSPLGDDSSHNANIFVLWKSLNDIKISKDRVIFLSSWIGKRNSAFFHIFYLFFKFLIIGKRDKKDWIFTHYSTLLFSLAIPRKRRYFFVQDLEWKFLDNNLFQYFLKFIILKIYSNGKIIVANDYLQEKISSYGLDIYGNADIWADVNFLETNTDQSVRAIDGVMVLRNGGYKRLDLYREFIFKSIQNNDITLAVITPEINIFEEFKDLVDYCYFTPSLEMMREIYSKSKIFLHFSDHEGFGLPPLEAMGAGCVPLCRDSGGINAYMRTLKFDGLILEKSNNVDQIIIVFKSLIANRVNLELLSKEVIKIFLLGLERGKLKLLINKTSLNYRGYDE